MRPLLRGSPFSLCSVAHPFLLILVLIGFIADLAAVPLLNVPLLYAILIMVAALLLPHCGVMIVAVLAFVAECVELLVPPNDIASFVADAGPMAIIGLLAVVLAQKRVDANAHVLVAEASRQTLQQFVQRVAHDLRGPLTILYGFAQVLEQVPSDPGLSDQNHELVQKIMVAAERMRRLFDELIDASRIAAAREEGMG